jgi:hypothetical protein
MASLRGWVQIQQWWRFYDPSGRAAATITRQGAEYSPLILPSPDAEGVRLGFYSSLEDAKAAAEAAMQNPPRIQVKLVKQNG